MNTVKPKHTASTLVLMTGLIASFLVWFLLDTALERARDTQFLSECEHIVERLQTQMDRQSRTLESLSGTLSSYVEIVRDVFEIAVSVPGHAQPGICFIGYAPMLSRDELGEYVEYVRITSQPRYFIHPPSSRERYLPVEHLASVSDVDTLYGWDLLSEPTVTAALNDTTHGEVFTVFPDESSHVPERKTLLLLPVIKDGVATGVVLFGMDLTLLLTNALTYAYDSTRIAIAVSRDAGGERTLFSPTTVPDIETAYAAPIRVGGETWWVHCSARSPAFQKVNPDIPSILLSSSVILSLVLFALVRRIERQQVGGPGSGADKPDPRENNSIHSSYGRSI